MRGWKAILWSGCASLSSLRRTEGALSKEGPFPKGSGNRPALLPPAHTLSHVGRVWDVTVLLLGAPPTPSLQLWTCCPLLFLLPTISEGRCSQVNSRQDPQQGHHDPWSRSCVLSGDVGSLKEGLRVCSAGRVEGRELGKPLREAGSSTAWTWGQTSRQGLRAHCTPRAFPIYMVSHL